MAIPIIVETLAEVTNFLSDLKDILVSFPFFPYIISAIFAFVVLKMIFEVA